MQGFLRLCPSVMGGKVGWVSRGQALLRWLIAAQLKHVVEAVSAEILARAG